MTEPASKSEVRLRWIILALLFAASFSNYFDRQTVSVLKSTLKSAFAIDDDGYARLVNAFTVCYAAAYLASGWLVDRAGPRVALTLFTAVWSAATIGCGLVHSLALLMALRALLGLAEPGFHPVAIRVGTAWTQERGRGVFMTLATLGGNVATIVAVPIIAAVATRWTWRVAFVLPGIVGLFVSAIWWRIYRDRPALAAGSAESSNRALAYPWGKIWLLRSFWGVVLVRLISDPVWYFCVFWMPGYLQESKHLTVAQLGVIGWIPFLAGNVGTIAFVAGSDRCADRCGLRGRKRLVIASAALAPLLWLIPHTASLALVIAYFSIVAVVCNAWTGSLAPIISEVFPFGNVASVWGIAGAFGATGAVAMNYLVGHAAGRWNPACVFLALGLLHPAAAVILHFLVKPAPLTPSVFAAAK